MKKHYRKAFNALKKIGAPVIEGGDSWSRIHFASLLKSNTDEKRWADYHEPSHKVDTGNPSLFVGVSVCSEITNILDEHKLFAEWINPGVLEVHDA